MQIRLDDDDLFGVNGPAQFSLQCGRPAGALLYSVARMRLSWTSTTPTCLRRQVDRRATTWATSMKVSYQVGLPK